jgi:hypothetical protein
MFFSSPVVSRVSGVTTNNECVLLCVLPFRPAPTAISFTKAAAHPEALRKSKTARFNIRRASIF